MVLPCVDRGVICLLICALWLEGTYRGCTYCGKIQSCVGKFLGVVCRLYVIRISMGPLALWVWLSNMELPWQPIGVYFIRGLSVGRIGLCLSPLHSYEYTVCHVTCMSVDVIPCKSPAIQSSLATFY